MKEKRNNVQIKLKKLGKKKIKQFEVELQSSVENLEDLIVEIVKSEVKRFNDKQENPSIVSFLSNQAINEQSESGKVSFGDMYNQDKAIEHEAIENALLAHTDGMFVVFVDDEEIKDLKENITITEHSEVVFLRLTFLTGTYW